MCGRSRGAISKDVKNGLGFKHDTMVTISKNSEGGPNYRLNNGCKGGDFVIEGPNGGCVTPLAKRETRGNSQNLMCVVGNKFN